MRALELAGAVIAAVCLGGGGLVMASGASAAPAPDSAGALLLSTDPSPLGIQDMPPGAETDWQVHAALDADTGSELTLAVEASGPMTTSAGGIRLSIQRCSAAWSSLSCPSGDPATVIPEGPLASVVGAAAVRVTHLTRTGSTHLLVRFSLPDAAGDAFAGTSASVRLVLTAGGDVDTVGTGPDAEPSALATTGVAVAGPALVGVGILLAGLVAASLRRRQAEAPA